MKLSRGLQAYTHMPTAILQQAAAVQNTWYTVLDLQQPLEVYLITETMNTAAEDIQARCTIDGTAFLGTQLAAVAGTVYFGVRNPITDTLDMTATYYMIGFRNAVLNCRTFKYEIRKVTAAGANRLDGTVVYGELL